MFEQKSTAQTSFIPKRPIAAGTSGVKIKKPWTFNVFLIASVIVFLGSCAAAAGSYYWKLSLETQIDTIKQSIAERESSLDQRLIEDMIARDRLLSAVNEKLAQHVSVSLIFDLLSKLTIEPVRFQSITLERKTPGVYDVALKGIGESFAAVSFQEKVLGDLALDRSLPVHMVQPVIANFTLATDGTISFGVEGKVMVDEILYIRGFEAVQAPIVEDVREENATTTTEPAGNSSTERSENSLFNFLR